jgi:hypothetical protein
MRTALCRKRAALGEALEGIIKAAPGRTLRG